MNEWSLAYDRNTVQQSQTYTDSAETLIFSYTGSLLASAGDVDKDNWYGQVISPT